MQPEITIVSACDRNFLWGAFLLAASAARFVPGIPVHILQTGFTAADAALFDGFPDVRLLPLDDSDPRNVANRKAEAVVTATTDYVAWLDADCMIIGDIRARLIPANGEFQIRLREPAENAWVWRNHYAPGETRGGLPASVLARWCADVGQLPAPRLDTTCVTNVFVLHQRHLDFIREWQRQIAKVIAPEHAGVVDSRSPAYFMTDESVFSSLLAFSRLAPPIGELRLNRDPHAHVAHFGANPKPWKRWRKQFWYCQPHVLDLLDWLRANGKPTPPVPWSFQRSATPAAWAIAQAEALYAKSRSTVGNLLRRN
ncbi:MAG: hypothetical protein WCJ14_01925 [Verrucomicrobiota bacterium]